MAFEEKRIDPQIDLIEAADSKPESQKGFDREEYLKTAHALRTYLSKYLCEHIESRQDRYNQCGRYHLAHMLHDCLTRFLRLFGRETLRHSGHEEVIRKEKTAVDKGTV